MLPQRSSENPSSPVEDFIVRWLFIYFAIAALAVFCFGGCSNLPPKPKGIIWIVDYPRSEVVGAPFGGFDLNQTTYKEWVAQHKALATLKANVVRKPLKDANKYICFDPDTWNRFDAWVKELQIYAQQRGVSP
jgi:hypothetical protein